MILTVTPNAALDKTYRVEPFLINRVNRPTLTHTLAGGKGINVARVFQTLGGKAIATGFLGGLQGEIVRQALVSEGIQDECLPVSGESRLCIAIIDPTTGTQTEINEIGHEVSVGDCNALANRIKELLSQYDFDFVVLCGSLPPGAPAWMYAELIEIVNLHGVKSVLDTSGEALILGIAAKPWMVKPNRHELETADGRTIADDREFLEAAIELSSKGIPTVVATNGATGAYLIVDSKIYQATPPEIEFASAVASGDSFLAAFLWGLAKSGHTGDWEYALQLAVGAGAANASVIGAGLCTRDSIFGFASRTEIRMV